MGIRADIDMHAVFALNNIRKAEKYLVEWGKQSTTNWINGTIDDKTSLCTILGALNYRTEFRAGCVAVTSFNGKYLRDDEHFWPGLIKFANSGSYVEITGANSDGGVIRFEAPEDLILKRTSTDAPKDFHPDSMYWLYGYLNANFAKIRQIDTYKYKDGKTTIQFLDNIQSLTNKEFDLLKKIGYEVCGLFVEETQTTLHIRKT